PLQGAARGRVPRRAAAQRDRQGDEARAGRRRREVIAIDGVSDWLGLRWEHADTVRLTIRPELINTAGLLSGPVAFALVDYCMGSTLWKQTTDEEGIATIGISINFVQSATEGDVVCTTKLERRNRTNAVLASEVRHDDGRLLAHAIGTFT